MLNRYLALAVCAIGSAVVLMLQLYRLIQSPGLQKAGINQYECTIRAAGSYGLIYDRTGKPLVNLESKTMAAVSPTTDSAEALFTCVTDPESFREKLSSGRPFFCELNTLESDEISADVPLFLVPVRTISDQPAQHFIGYAQNGKGVAGLEAAYDELLRSYQTEYSFTYELDGRGSVLSGIAAERTNAESVEAGVYTTLHLPIQSICEQAADQIDKGAVLVLDAKTGDILAGVSRPVYDVNALSDSLDSPDAPFVNRCLQAYGVGSIFKLVTAAAALESGLRTDFHDVCSGACSIRTQTFRCHNLAGHGTLDMFSAMTGSCNVYFIHLGNLIGTDTLLHTAKALGFGEEISLCETIVSAAGTLPDAETLKLLPAEKANFSFGQGVLTATPLQVARMTCAIANDGLLPSVRLVRGFTDGTDWTQWSDTAQTRAITAETAEILQQLMRAAVADNPDSNAVPSYTTAAAKTSTAQTGRYDENGVEYCHGWITGYVPAEDPKYVITVFSEDGGYGNDVAAPIFREIADGLSAYF